MRPRRRCSSKLVFAVRGASSQLLSSDAENLFVTVTARALNPELFIVARSSHESTEAKLLKAGANRTITPNVIGGRRMASMVLHPTVSDYLDIVSSGAGVEFRLKEIELAPDVVLRGAARSPRPAFGRSRVHR